MNFYEGKRKEAHFMLDRVIDTLIAKNTDYGDSFSITGRVGASTRLMDKATRLFTLSCNNNEPQVKDEAIEDTAKDLFAYALMNILKFYPTLTWNPDDDVEQQIEKCCNNQEKQQVAYFPINTDEALVLYNPYYTGVFGYTHTEIDDAGQRFGKVISGIVSQTFIEGMLIGLQKNRVMTNWYEEIPLMIENLIKKEKV